MGFRRELGQFSVGGMPLRGAKCHTNCFISYQRKPMKTKLCVEAACVKRKKILEMVHTKIEKFTMKRKIHFSSNNNFLWIVC